MNWPSILAVSAACIFFALVIYRAMPDIFNALFRLIGRMFGWVGSQGASAAGEVVSYG